MHFTRKPRAANLVSKSINQFDLASNDLVVIAHSHIGALYRLMPIGVCV